MAETSIPLKDIIDIEGIPDRALDRRYVDALVATNEPDKWPPIIVTPIGDKYGRIAGKHRIAAALRLKLPSLPGTIRSYESKAAMYTAMWDDNVGNALALTTTQRKEYAVTLYRLDNSLSLREMGRRTGLPHQTVKAAIQDALEDAEAQKADSEYYQIQDYTRKLLTALVQFYEHENAILGKSDGARSEQRRAKALTRHLDTDNDMADIYASLGRTFNLAAQLLRPKR